MGDIFKVFFIYIPALVPQGFDTVTSTSALPAIVQSRSHHMSEEEEEEEGAPGGKSLIFK